MWEKWKKKRRKQVRFSFKDPTEALGNFQANLRVLQRS